MRFWPRFVGPVARDKTGVPGAGDSGRLPGREDVLVQRQKRDCAPWEGTAAMYADLDSVLRTLPQWQVSIAVTVAAHGFGVKVREREGETWDMSAGEVGKLVHDVVESCYARLNGLSVSSA